jgi:hypothetical protein
MAKRSRRTRRQEKATPAPNASVAQTPAAGVAQKAVDFVGEYAYIYKELRTVLIIAIVMFVVLFGLSYLLY